MKILCTVLHSVCGSEGKVALFQESNSKTKKILRAVWYGKHKVGELHFVVTHSQILKIKRVNSAINILR